MRWVKRWAKRLRVLVRKDVVERELDEEMTFHLQMETEKNLRAGMSPREARRRAVLAFGGAERAKEEVRSARWAAPLESVGADLRYALRGMRRSPRFAAAAVLTLALGIGGTTAVFSVVDSLFFRAPEGVDRPDEVVQLLVERDEGIIRTPGGGSGSYVDYEALRSRTHVFSALAAHLYPSMLDLGRGVEAEQVRGRAVTANFLSLLGVRPVRGRTFAAEEDGAPGAHPVAVISHGFWKRRFGGDPEVVGRTLLLNGQQVTVIGVAEPGFTGIEPEPEDVWVPIAMAAPLGMVFGGSAADDWRLKPNMAMVRLTARLAPGVSPEHAAREAAAALRQVADVDAGMDPTPGVVTGSLIPARGNNPSKAARLSLWLAVVSVMVLLIACANVASLLLARSTVRRRELAVRLSLGAGRVRVARQLLTESLLLAVLGGVAGLLVAFWGSRLTRQFPLPPGAGELNGRLLAFTLGVSLITGLLFGLAPALRSLRTDPVEGLKDSRSGASPARGRLQRALVMLQVCLCVVLLVGAGLFVRSLRQVYAINPGVDLERLLVVSADLARVGYSPEDREAFYRTAIERVAAVPGVQGAALVHFPPFGTSSIGMSFRVAGRDSIRFEDGPYTNLAGAGYFETVGIPILRGRGITAADGPGSEPVAVVTELLARQIAPGGDALGTCMAVGDQVKAGGCTRIVGVAADVRRNYLEEPRAPIIYLSREREPHLISWGGPALVVRTRGAASPEVAAQVRAAIQGLRPDLPYVIVKPLEESIHSDVLPYRLGAMLFSLFGLLALVLAAVGVYGLLSYFVAERTPEIGIRRSLGAPAPAVLAFVARQGLVPVAAGLVIGLGVALAGTRLMESLFFGVAPRDPLTFGFAAVFLLAVAVVAVALPARRATSVDPMVALRAD